MGHRRTESRQQVADLLRTAKRSLRLSVAFMTRMDGTTQHLEVVESSVPVLFPEGGTQVQETSFCQAVLDGRLPAVMPDVRRHREAMRLPAARMPRIRSFVSVPVRLSDGSLYGTFCAAGLTTDRELSSRDQALMEVLAHAASVIIEPGIVEAARREEVRSRLDPVLAAGGPDVLLQPVVDLRTGARPGAEALSRFPRAWGKAPDVCFAEAHGVGDGDRLELLALRRAAEHLTAVTGYVAMNVSPATLLGPDVTGFLRGLPLERVVLELSEHDAVADYDALGAALAPLRAAGMRLAVDDVGAGFSSLRHIVVTQPDIIKLDRSIVAGVSDDHVLTTLVRSLVAFGHGCGASVVAEGLETAEDVLAVAELGVDLGQGWFFGRPGPPDALVDTLPAPTAVPRQAGRAPSVGPRVPSRA